MGRSDGRRKHLAQQPDGCGTCAMEERLDRSKCLRYRIFPVDRPCNPPRTEGKNHLCAKIKSPHRPWLEYPFPTTEMYPATPVKKIRGTVMFHLLWTAIIGLIVGAIAKFIIPVKDPGGFSFPILICFSALFGGT